MSEPLDEVEALWRDFKATGDPDLRNRLVLQYSPLVKFVAGRVGVGLPRSVDRGDLMSDGVIGLIDAIDKFDPGRGRPFQSYAVSRIRGAIIDGLRASDWVPRSVRDRLRAIERAQRALESDLGRAPTEEELAAEMQVSVRELRETLGRAPYTGLMSLDEVGDGDELGPAVTDSGWEDEDLRASLLEAVRDLPERDQVIVALYYFERLTLAEIGQVLGVSESRVSQLHTRVTLALRAKLAVAHLA